MVTVMSFDESIGMCLLLVMLGLVTVLYYVFCRPSQNDSKATLQFPGNADLK